MGIFGNLFGKKREDDSESSQSPSLNDWWAKKCERDEERRVEQKDYAKFSARWDEQVAARREREQAREAREKEVISTISTLTCKNYLSTEEERELRRLDIEARNKGYQPPKDHKFNSSSPGFRYKS